MAKRRPPKALLALAMVVLIAAGAGLFFLIGSTATEVAKENLVQTSTPTAKPGGLSFAELAGRQLDASQLKPAATGFSNPHGIGIFGGTLYVSDWGEDKLFAVNPETGSKRLLADELDGAHDMVLDGEGNIVTPLFGDGRVVRVNTESGAVRELADGFSGPNGIITSRDGGYYVTNARDGTVVKVSEDGDKRVIARDLAEPAGIVVDNDNIIRTAQFDDPQDSVVQVFDNGKLSSVVTGLTNAESLLYDDHKNLLIGHVVNGRGAVTLFTAGGQKSLVLQTDLPGPLIGPVTDGKYLYLQSAAAGQTAVYRIPLS